MIELLKALADENRMRLYNLLQETELCVCELETLLLISQSNTSRHLNKLKQAGIISFSKEAQWVHYKVSDEFKEEHSDLAVYLNKSLSKKEPFVSDTAKMKKYFDLGLNCTDIKENSDRVIELIESK